MLQSTQVCPIDVINLICFDEHGHTFDAGTHKSETRRVLVKI